MRPRTRWTTFSLWDRKRSRRRRPRHRACRFATMTTRLHGITSAAFTIASRAASVRTGRRRHRSPHLLTHLTSSPAIILIFHAHTLVHIQYTYLALCTDHRASLSLQHLHIVCLPPKPLDLEVNIQDKLDYQVVPQAQCLPKHQQSTQFLGLSLN